MRSMHLYDTRIWSSIGACMLLEMTGRPITFRD